MPDSNSSIRRDKIIVVDIEATCWYKNRIPPGMQAEIIEVGVCSFVLDTNQPNDKRGILVRPTRSKVGEFCTQLTTLTPELVSGGVTFAEACAILEEDYESRSYLWVSWGDYDRNKFRAQCRDFGVDYPFSDRHVNLKTLYTKLYDVRKIGMKRALKHSGLALEGTLHRGVDDAWNIARLLGYLIERFGEDIFLDAWME